MTPEQKTKLASMFAKEHVAVIVTQGEQWPTATMQAFAETEAMDLLFIMGRDSEKFQNALGSRYVTVLVDTRDIGDIPKFQVERASVQGMAEEVARDGAEWEPLKAFFLAKNPFEAPFFANDQLRMLRVRPKRISYAGPPREAFKVEL